MVRSVKRSSRSFPLTRGKITTAISNYPASAPTPQVPSWGARSNNPQELPESCRSTTAISSSWRCNFSSRWFLGPSTDNGYLLPQSKFGTGINRRARPPRTPARNHAFTPIPATITTFATTTPSPAPPSPGGRELLLRDWKMATSAELHRGSKYAVCEALHGHSLRGCTKAKRLCR